MVSCTAITSTSVWASVLVVSALVSVSFCCVAAKAAPIPWISEPKSEPALVRSVATLVDSCAPRVRSPRPAMVLIGVLIGALLLQRYRELFADRPQQDTDGELLEALGCRCQAARQRHLHFAVDVGARPGGEGGEEPSGLQGDVDALLHGLAARLAHLNVQVDGTAGERVARLDLRNRAVRDVNLWPNVDRRRDGQRAGPARAELQIDQALPRAPRHVLPVVDLHRLIRAGVL